MSCSSVVIACDLSPFSSATDLPLVCLISTVEPRQAAEHLAETLVARPRLPCLHRGHLRNTGIGQREARKGSNVAPEQVACATIDADEQYVPGVAGQSPTEFYLPATGVSHDTRISQVAMSVLEKASAEMNLKFL